MSSSRTRKSNPDKVAFGSPGANTSLHITMEEVAWKQGIKWLHVPHKGNAPNMQALLGGHVDAAADATGWGPHVNSGRLRLLVTWGDKRTKRWPDVPTLKELGFGIVSNSPYGLAGPKGMDPKVVKILHDAFKKGAEDPIHAGTLEKYDQELWYQSPEDYARYAARDVRSRESHYGARKGAGEVSRGYIPASSFTSLRGTSSFSAAARISSQVVESIGMPAAPRFRGARARDRRRA